MKKRKINLQNMRKIRNFFWKSRKKNAKIFWKWFWNKFGKKFEIKRLEMILMKGYENMTKTRKCFSISKKNIIK